MACQSSGHQGNTTLTALAAMIAWEKLSRSCGRAKNSGARRTDAVEAIASLR